MKWRFWNPIEVIDLRKTEKEANAAADHLEAALRRVQLVVDEARQADGGT